jgi:Na+:H+ antiporter, NhaA family
VIRKLINLTPSFPETEVMSGVVLLAAAVVALVWANSPWDSAYQDLLGHVIAVDLGPISIEEDIQHWINDGLMTVFFFVVGLEIKRELLRGELAGRERALLPVFAAVGGMIAPALIYLAVNAGGPGAHGWGIPMATDIALALGILALLGNRVPPQLRIFLLAVAIADDIGSIFVIVVFYAGDVEPGWLVGAMAIVIGIYAMRLAGVRAIFAYIPAGFLLWLAVSQSGVSTALAGVVLGLMTPLHEHYGPRAWRDNVRTLAKLLHSAERRDAELSARPPDGDGGSPLERLESLVQPFSSFIIVPLFAFANAGVSLSSDALKDSVTSAITHGIVLGFLLGKPLGILLFSWVAVRLGLASLPQSVRWVQVLGVGIMGGIGFTVALYVNALAFESASRVDAGKIGILAASLLSGAVAYLTLRAVAAKASDSRLRD